MATFTFQFGEDFVHELAAAIVRLQMGGTEGTTQSPEWPSAPPPDDPWSAPGPGPAGPTAAPAAPPGPAPAPQAGSYVVNTPKGPQTWTLGLANAPVCGCGQTSAYIQGTTNGRAWARYGCAKAKDRETYRSKCDFSQWA